MQKDAKAKMFSGCVRTTCRREASIYALPVRRRAKRLQRRTEIVHLSTGYCFVAIETRGAAALYAQQFRLFLFIPRLFFSSFLPKKRRTLWDQQHLTLKPDEPKPWESFHGKLGRSGAQSLEPSVPEVTIARGSEWHDTNGVSLGGHIPPRILRGTQEGINPDCK